MKRLTFILAIFLNTTVSGAGLGRAEEIYFDDSGPEIMVLGNGTYYEIGFRKSHGAIAYITDKCTGQHVTVGSRYECLWGAVFPAGTPEHICGGRSIPLG